MTALLDLEPRDAGRMPEEPHVEFAVPADDLHDRTRCSDTECLPHLTNVCHVVTA
jgi:hypothetical protein